jgi:predicted nucleic-acid-binding Zn-ribbon protein
MSTDLSCPKCAANEYIIDESDLDFINITGQVSEGTITSGIRRNNALKLTCSLCGHHYKSGDYHKKQIKIEAARLAFKATQNGNQMKAVLIYALLAVLVTFIAYKFFNANQTIFGYVFSTIALVLSIIAITGFIFTPKGK